MLVVGIPGAIIGIPAKNPLLIVPSMLLNAAGVLGVLIGGGCALLSLRARVALCEHGLYYTWFARAIPCRWTEITGVYEIEEGAGIWPTISLRFDREGDKSFTLEGLIRGQADLAARLREILLPRLRPQILKALERGELVAFGELLSVGPKGMRFRPKGPKGEELRLSWKEIDSISLGRFLMTPGAGGLMGARNQPLLRVICDGRPEWDINPGNIANFPLLVQLLETHFQVRVDNQLPQRGWGGVARP
jgi:hypothetical protein